MPTVKWRILYARATSWSKLEYPQNEICNEEESRPKSLRRRNKLIADLAATIKLLQQWSLIFFKIQFFIKLHFSLQSCVYLNNHLDALKIKMWSHTVNSGVTFASCDLFSRTIDSSQLSISWLLQFDYARWSSLVLIGRHKSDRFATSALSHQLLSRMFANGDNLLPNADPALNDVLLPIVVPGDLPQ